MARRIFILVSFFLLLSTVMMGAPCERPTFRGDVYAATIRSASLGEVVVYWVFDRNSFTEYIHHVQSGETELIASARYTKLDSSYSIEIPRTRSIGGQRKLDAAPQAVNAELRFADAGLILPNGEHLVKVVDALQYIPELQHGLDALRVEATSTNDTCCCSCWSTHRFLGITFLDGICCFFNGGCGDASGFCGGGGGSTW